MIHHPLRRLRTIGKKNGKNPNHGRLEQNDKGSTTITFRNISSTPKLKNPSKATLQTNHVWKDYQSVVASY